MKKALCAVAVCWTSVASVSLAQTLAFPEAEGFGRFATGARTTLASASVYHVTNLNDSGAGSFRDAVSQANRFVVFDVGGIVNLGSSPLTFASNLTIAGQTAPGGIAFYGNRAAFHGANNLVARYFAVRLGTSQGREDAASMVRGTNMMFDHMSITWGVDGTFDINPDTGQTIDNITIQNSIVGQGLDAVGHSTGGLMTLGEGNRFSIIKSLFADNVTRNPKVRGENEFINNVVYGYQTSGYIMGDTSATSHANVEGNYFIEGPIDGSSPFASGTSTFHIYGRDNWVDGDKDGVLDGSLTNSYPGADVLSVRNAFPTLASMTAQEAVAFILKNAGVSITRDAVDTRLMQELASYGTLGGVIDRDSDLFPGYGTDAKYLNPRARLTDTDNDGMPDNWETARGLNPSSNADWKNLNNGYTRLEEYLNELGGYNVTKTATAGAWTTAGTWGGAVPTFADTVVAANGLTHASGNAFARQMLVTGTASISGGTLDVFDTLQTSGGTLTVSGGTVSAGRVLLGTGTMSLTGGTVQTMYVTGAGALDWNGGTIKAMGGPLTVSANATLGANGGFINSNGFTTTISGALSGGGGLTKDGNGTAILSGNNTFTGKIRIRNGALQVSALNNSNTAGQLGMAATDAANIEIDGGTLKYAGDTSTSTDRLFSVTNKGGTLDAGSTGQWRFLNTGTIGTPGTGDRTLALAGSTSLSDLYAGLGDPTSGKTTLLKTGTGRWILTNSNRTYSGPTVISNGTLMTNSDNPLPFGAGKGNLQINAGSFEMNGRNLAINGLEGAGTLNQRGNSAKVVTLGYGDATATFSGVISQVPSSQTNTLTMLSLVKTGLGTQTLSGANTYQGMTQINAGTLLVNGTHSGGGLYTIASGGTLGGTGNVGSSVSIVAGGKLAPGTTAGTLTVSGVTLANDATLAIDINGRTAGTYDQLAVNGTVSLGDADLVLSVAGKPVHNDRFFILKNDGTDAISGTLAGLAEGATLTTVGSDFLTYRFQITYFANAEAGTPSGGNDVMLTAVPEPATAGLLMTASVMLLRRRRITA